MKIKQLLDLKGLALVAMALMAGMIACNDDDTPGIDTPETGLAVTAIDPIEARQLDTITVTGRGFASTLSQNEVRFSINGDTDSGKDLGQILEGTDTTLTVIVPYYAALTTGPITIEVGGETATSEVNFELDTDLGQARLLSISPDNSYSGQEVTLEGHYFGTTADNEVVVYFGEMPGELISLQAKAGGQGIKVATVKIPDGMTEGDLEVSLERDGVKSKNTLSYHVSQAPMDVRRAYVASADGIIVFEVTENGLESTTLPYKFSGGDAGNAIVLDYEGGYYYYVNEFVTIIKASLTDENDQSKIFNDTYIGGIAIDKENGKLFATTTDFTDSYIKRMDIDGTNMEILSKITIDQSVFAPFYEQITYDKVSNKLYFTDFGSGKVMRMGTDGSDLETLFEASDAPGSMATLADVVVDATTGKLYVSNTGYNNDGAIYVGNSDGTGALTNVPGISSLDWVKGLDIDVENGYLYWIDKMEEADQNAGNSLFRVRRVSLGDNPTTDVFIEDIFSGNDLILDIQ